jgi:hypothetical protein
MPDRFTESVEAVLKEIANYRVRCLHTRGRKLAMELEGVSPSHKATLLLDGFISLMDSGIHSAALTKADLGPTGSYGLDVSLSEQMPEVAHYLELMLWNADDPVMPRFRALAKSARVVRGGVQAIA